jgi:ABC-type bacteriocin/lantibiotic exporter with double-glycine peptidase domain
MKKLKLLFQENEFDCGIASVAMVYNAVYNKDQSLDYFKNFFPNKKDGLTLKEIEHCSISLGLTFNSFSSTIEEIKQTIKKQYVIALINKEDVFHYVVIKKITDDSIIYLDSLLGEKKITYKEFNEEFTKICLVLEDNTKPKKESNKILVSIIKDYKLM